MVSPACKVAAVELLPASATTPLIVSAVLDAAVMLSMVAPLAFVKLIGPYTAAVVPVLVVSSAAVLAPPLKVIGL